MTVVIDATTSGISGIGTTRATTARPGTVHTKRAGTASSGYAGVGPAVAAVPQATGAIIINRKTRMRAAAGPSREMLRIFHPVQHS